MRVRSIVCMCVCVSSTVCVSVSVCVLTYLCVHVSAHTYVKCLYVCVLTGGGHVCAYLLVGKGVYVCTCANVVVYACIHLDEKCSMPLNFIPFFTSSTCMDNGSTLTPSLHLVLFINEHFYTHDQGVSDAESSSSVRCGGIEECVYLWWCAEATAEG